MYQFLHAEPFDQTALRGQAAATVAAMDVICGCAEGDVDGYRALLAGFWPYVYDFEKAIDRRMLRMMPRGRLSWYYGSIRIQTFLKHAIAAVCEMRDEEGSHAKLWKDDAERNGFMLDLTYPLPGVQRLMDCARVNEPILFFAHLAATEFIAEELTQLLFASDRFMERFFPDGRWPWGEAHLRHPGASHLDVDLDLARAMYLSRAMPEGDLPAADEAITKAIGDRLLLFYHVAQEVHRNRGLFK